MKRLRAIVGWLTCSVVLLCSAVTASAIGLSASATANYTPLGTSIFGLNYTGTSFALGNGGAPISTAYATTSHSPASTDSQPSGFAFAVSASDPFHPYRFAEATGQVFDDGGVNGTGTAAASLNGPVSSQAYAFMYQPFVVTGDGTMTYVFDYNFFMLPDNGPGSATGTNNVRFQLGLWDSNTNTPITTTNEFTDSVSFNGNPLDLTGFGALSFDFTDGQSGFFYAYAGSFAEVDAPPVPEPSTFLLVGAGLTAMMWYRRKRA